MFYGIVNKLENRLYYSNGGQFPYPLLFDGSSVRSIECKCKPVGLFDFAEYRVDTLELPHQFTMILLSDGILEVLPHSNLREKRNYLVTLIEKTGFDNEAFARQLGQSIGVTLPDDITLLQIRKRDKTK